MKSRGFKPHYGYLSFTNRRCLQHSWTMENLLSKKLAHKPQIYQSHPIICFASPANFIASETRHSTLQINLQTSIHLIDSKDHPASRGVVDITLGIQFPETRVQAPTRGWGCLQPMDKFKAPIRLDTLFFFKNYLFDTRQLVVSIQIWTRLRHFTEPLQLHPPVV